MQRLGGFPRRFLSVLRLLPPGGANGQVLKKASATDYDATWQTDETGVGGGGSPQGRLTLTSVSPVMTSTVSGATSIYYTPYNGRNVPLYNGSSFTMTDVGGELSQTTNDSTKSPAACTTNSNYDLFVWDDGGTKRCTRGPAWSTDTSRGTGAGTTELTRVAGIWLNANNISNGPAAQRGTFVGTIRTNGSSQVDWIYGVSGSPPTAAVHNVWNAYNRIAMGCGFGENTSSWTISQTTWREVNSRTTFEIRYVCGLAENPVTASYYATGTGGASTAFSIGIGIDTTSTPTGIIGIGLAASNMNPVAAYEGVPGIGYHFLAAIETAGNLSSSPTFYGTGGFGQTGVFYSITA